MKDNSDMKDKYALVTGAAKGIGKSSVLHLAKAGINVAINYRSSEKEAELLRKEVEAGAHGTLDYTIKEGVNKNKIANEKILKSKK